MKNTIILIVALVIGINFSYAGNENETENAAPTSSLSGTIVDKISGETLAGVKVKLDKNDQIVFTDFDGNFTFENLPPGDYELEVSMISYEKSELKVKHDAKNADPLQVNLESKK